MWLLSLAFSGALLLCVLAPAGAILFSRQGTVRARWTWTLVCILALIAGIAIWVLRMRYLASTSLSKGADTRFIFVLLLPWLVYGCFRYRASDLPRVGNVVLGFAVGAVTVVGFWSIDVPPDIDLAQRGGAGGQPSGLYQFLSVVPSPWLQVLVLLALFAAWLSALAAFAVWLDKRVAQGARRARGALKFVVIGLVAVTGLMLAGFFGEVGQRTGLGRDAWFLAYWVALLFASFLPFAYIANRTGLFPWK